MINYEYADLFLKDSVDKQLSIQYPSGTITNAELHSQQFELTESLCSESQLRFGSCESSSITFKISNIFTSLKDKWLTVSEVLDGHTAEPFLFGQFKVESDVPTADRRCRDVVAYDKMHEILTADVITWYNTILPNADSTVTLKQFRDSFMAYFGITQEAVTLINDSMTVEKTIDPSELSGKTVITAICELNGCFGHIGRDGTFQYIFLIEMEEGLYPRNDLYPSNKLYPREESSTTRSIQSGIYMSADYEDYIVEKIDKLQIRQEENDIGCIYGNGSNCYIVEDNFLVYGKSSAELQTIAANLYTIIHGTWYRPAHVEAKGNPCLEVGDGIRLSTKYEIVHTYILQRTLKGIQALRDTYDAEGDQYQLEDVNSVHKDIVQLKGKSNKLERTIEETKLTITNIEEGLESQILQTADEIRTAISQQITETKEYADSVASNAETNAKADTTEKLKRYSTTQQMNSAIDQKADSITSTVNQKITETKEYADSVASNAETNAKADTTEKLNAYSTTTEMNSAITQSANSIKQEVSETYETKTNASSKYTELSSSITLASDSITAEVSRAQTEEGKLASRITVNATNINLKVSKGSVSSEISQEAGKISIKSNRFSLESTNCTITETGKIKASDVELSGKITATSGTIGGFTIGSASLYNGTNSMSSTSNGVYIGTDGINLGGGKFKVTNAGKTTLSDLAVTGNGSIDFSYASNKMHLDYSGIKFGSTSWNTSITHDEVRVYNSYIDQDGLHVRGTSATYYTDISQNKITFGSSSTDPAKIYVGSNYMISITTTRTTLLGSAMIAGSGGSVGFFGSTGTSKKTVSNIATPSSASASTIATKLNELLTALRGYGLIG